MALKDLIAGGIGSLAEKVGGVVDRFVQTQDEKAAVKLELEKLARAAEAELEETIRTELGAKERVLVAELTQGDKYTKRARPSVVYWGMVIMTFNYSLVPFIFKMAGHELETLPLPPEFWYGWSGIVATWSVGRTMERRGVGNNLVKIVTGSKQAPSILGE